MQVATDKNFLDTLLDYPEIVSQIEAVAAALSRGHAPQSQRPARHSNRLSSTDPLVYAAATVQTQTAAAESPADCTTRLRAMGKSLMLDLAALFAPFEATKQAFDAVASANTIPQTYKDCVAEREAQSHRPACRLRDFATADDPWDCIPLLGSVIRYTGRVGGCARKTWAQRITNYQRAGGAVWDAALANIGSLFERPGLTAAGWLGAVISDWHGENFEEARQHYQRLSKAVADGACSGEEEEESEGEESIPPETPTNLRVVSVTTDTITLAWDVVAGVEGVEYGVYVYANGLGSAPTLLRPVDNTSATIQGLEPDETLCVTVTAISDVGESYPATPICGTTLALAAPTNLRVTEVGADFIDLEWDPPPEGGMESYIVLWGFLGGEGQEALGTVKTTSVRVRGIGDRDACFTVRTVSRLGIEDSGDTAGSGEEEDAEAGPVCIRDEHHFSGYNTNEGINANGWCRLIGLGTVRSDGLLYRNTSCQSKPWGEPCSAADYLRDQWHEITRIIVAGGQTTFDRCPIPRDTFHRYTLEPLPRPDDPPGS